MFIFSHNEFSEHTFWVNKFSALNHKYFKVIEYEISIYNVDFFFFLNDIQRYSYVKNSYIVYLNNNVFCPW